MAARGNAGDRCRHTGVQLVALAAILFAAFAFAQPAAAQDASGGGEPPASTETGTSDATEGAEAPAAEGDAAPATESEPAESTESTEPAGSSAPAEPAEESEPAGGSEGTEASEPAPSNEAPADPPDDAVKMEEEAPPADSEPAEEGTPTPESAPAAETGCGASASADTQADTSGGSASADATCTGAASEAEAQPATPSAPAEPREQSSPPATSTTPAPQAAPAAAPEGSQSIVLVVSAPAEAEPEAAEPEPASEPQPLVAVVQPEAAVAEPAAVNEALAADGVSLGAPDPLIGLALTTDSPVRARLIAAGGKAAVRKLVSCARPGARVPLSRTCSRLRAAAVLGLRASPWPSSQASAAALREAGGVATRAEGRRAARTSKTERRAPTIERAEPSNYRSKGPWASTGSTGGSSAGSGTLRIFALTAAAVLPFVRPRAVRARMRASLVPVGELGVSLPERPG